jgi:putative acetyltransferase
MSDSPTAPLSPIILTRPEQPALYAAIRAVHLAAFGRPDEADLVEALRAHEDFNPKLSLMGLYNGQVAGHILFTPLRVEGSENARLMGLGPMGVLPDYQRQMVGSALVYEGLELLRRAKVAAVFVLGEPHYYKRFGFRPARDYGCSCKYDPAGEHFMAQELIEEGLAGVGGLVHYLPPFDGV